MTEEVKPKFLKSIKFEKEFLPFEEGTEIEFGGEKEVQRMIEFYLKNKGIENYKENAERFKINCVLGNNGGGKSRLFRGIYGCFNKNINIESSVLKFNIYGLDRVRVKNNLFSPINNYTTLLDDFFKLSSNINFSLNNDNLNFSHNKEFYFHLQKFLENKKIQNIYTSFFNISIRFNVKLNINFKLNTISDRLDFDNIQEEYDNSLFDFFDSSNIDVNFIEELLYQKETYNIGSVENGKDSTEVSKGPNGEPIYSDIDEWLYSMNDNDFQFLYKLLKKHGNDFIYIFIYNNGYIYDLIQYHYKHDFQMNEEIDRNSREYLVFFELLKEKGLLNTLPISVRKLIDKVLLCGKKDLQDFIKNIYQKGKKINISYELSDNISSNLIKFFSGNSNISLDIGHISFNKLSAGQQTILMRFTNIYKKILEKKENGKTDFLILIDEPDLHLHLDWQRQYIQKLIDVFSTLDSEISLHFIIATHSPFIISDLPTESIIILDGGENNEHQGTFTEVKNYSEKITIKNKDGKEIEKFKYQTFGANYIDIIKNGFFFEDKMLMGSFAQENIEKASKKLKAKLFIEALDITDDNFNKNSNLLNSILEKIGAEKVEDYGDYENKKEKIFKGVDNVKNNIGDDFLQNNLMYLN